MQQAHQRMRRKTMKTAASRGVLAFSVSLSNDLVTSLYCHQCVPKHVMLGGLVLFRRVVLLVVSSLLPPLQCLDLHHNAGALLVFAEMCRGVGGDVPEEEETEEAADEHLLHESVDDGMMSWWLLDHRHDH